MKLKILVFDDDVNIRNMLKTALESKGHEVTTLADPTEFKYYDIRNQDVSTGLAYRAGAVQLVEIFKLSRVSEGCHFMPFTLEGSFKQVADVLIIIKNQNL